MSCGCDSGSASGGLSIISCNTTMSNVKTVTFSDNNLAIQQGANTLFSLPLGGFYLPIENYLYTEITLQPGDTTNLLFTGGIGDVNGKVKILSMFSVYDSTVTDPAQAYLEWAFYDGSPTLNYKPSGPILMLTAQEGHLIDSIIVRNPTTAPILIKVIAGK